MNARRILASSIAAFAPRLIGAHLAIMTLLAFGFDRTEAASGQWRGTTDGNWSTMTNWSPNGTPGTGDTATFGIPNNGQTTISLGSGVTIGNVSFASATSSYSIGAGAAGSETLTLDHGGIIGAYRAVDQFINAALVLGANATTAAYTIYGYEMNGALTIAGPIRGGTGGVAGTKTLQFGLEVANDGNALVSGAIGGGGGTTAVTKAGTGTLTLSGGNSFTGALKITHGTVSVPVFNNASSNGPLGNSAGAVQFAQGAGSFATKLSYTGGTASSTKPLAIAGSGGSGTLEITQAATELTLSGVLSGTNGYYTKTGPGTLTLAGANTFSGGLTLTAGTVKLSGVGTLGASGSDVFFNGAAVLDLGGKSPTVGNFSSIGAGGMVVNNSGAGVSLLTINPTTNNGSFDGVIADNNNATAGTVALTQDGTGPFTLTGANTYSGATNLTGYSLTIAGNGTLGNTVGATTVATGATLRLAVTSCAEAITISGVGIQAGEGALEGYDTTLTGLLALGASATVCSFAPPGNAFAITNPGTILGPGRTLTLSGFSGSAGSIASIIGTTTGGVTVTDETKWTLTGANTFSGIVTVNGNSTLIISTINNAGAPGPLGSSSATTAMSLTTGTLEYTGASASSTKRFTLSTSGTIQIDNAVTELTLSGIVAGAGGALIKAGSGTLTLSGVNTYSGGTTVSAGTLKLSGGNNRLATTGTLSVNAALDLNGTSQTVGAFGGNGTIFNNGGGTSTLTFTQPASTLSGFSGVISDNTNATAGSIALTKAGTGAVILSGANTYSGVTLVSAGMLGLSGIGTLGDPTGGTTVSSGATLQFSALHVGAEAITISGTGASAAYGGALYIIASGDYSGLLKLAAAATINMASGTFDFTNTGAITGAFAFTLAGAGNASLASQIATSSLIKDGTGRWTLTGANTYAGTTTISEGILNIQNASALGTTAGGTTVANGATLQIEGDIAIGAETLTISGAGASGMTGALQNVGGANAYGGLLSLGANSTISSDAGTLSLTHTGTINEAFNLTLAGAGDGALASVIGTGAHTVTKTGTGTWTLSGANTFTGVLTIANGTLAISTINNASVAGPLGNSATAVTLGAAGGMTGALEYTGTAGSSTKPFALAAGGTGVIRLGSASNELTLGGVIGGSGALTIAGSGKLTLTGVNTFTGALTVGGLSTLSIATFNNASTNGPLGNSAGAVSLFPTPGTGYVTLEYTGGSATSNKPFALAGGGIFSITSAAANLTLTGGISGSGYMAKEGPGTITLSTANSFAGATHVNAGTFIVSAAGAMMNGYSLVLNGGTFLLSGTGGLDRIRDAEPVILFGGTLSMAGLSNESETLGPFSLGANSVIDFGAGSGDSLIFAGLDVHNVGTKLSITNWSGTPRQLGGAANDRLIFGGLASAFLAAYSQSDVSFNGVTGYAAIQFDASHYEVVLPEPSAAMLLLFTGLLGFGAGRLPRRRRAPAPRDGGAWMK